MRARNRATRMGSRVMAGGRRKLRVTLTAVAGLCLCPLVAGPGLTQERPECEEGLVAVGDLGITQLEGAIQIAKPDESGDVQIVLRFMSEPVVREIDPDGPAVGKIRKGDVIVAVNGNLITTEGAGDAFVDPPVGVPVELRVRRDGKEGKVTIVPDWICVEKDSAVFPHWVNIYKRIIMGVAPRVREEMEERARKEARETAKERERESKPHRPDAGRVPRAPKPPRSDIEAVPHPERPERTAVLIPGLPHPWMGFGLECSIDGNWATEDLRFTEPPRVFRVEPDSKAKEAGLRRRDVITHIDGIPIDTLEGTERFTKITPGQRVEWKVLRDGKPVNIVMIAEPITRWAYLLKEPDTTIVRGAIIHALRYSGVLGNTAIEVRGSAPVNVTVDEATGQVIIQTPDTTVRLKRTEQHYDK